MAPTPQGILDRNPRVEVLDPYNLKWPKFYEMYKKHKALRWEMEEIDFSKDRDSFEKMSPGKQHLLKHVLAFFAVADGLVNENASDNFYSEIQSPEARAFYTVQMMIETVHAETYAASIHAIGISEEEKDQLFDAVANFPCIAKKIKWMNKWMNDSMPIAQRLVAFAAIEGIFFSASFAYLSYWQSGGGKEVPGICKANEFISRDEGLHQEFSGAIFRQIQKEIVSTNYRANGGEKNKVSEDVALQIIREAAEIEKIFVRESLRPDVLGLNVDEMVTHVESVANRLVNYDLGFEQTPYPKVGNTTPLQFMTNRSLSGKSNFFEERVSEYTMNKDLGPKVLQLDVEV